MVVVRFLEREKVIKVFGLGLILAPFINMGLHLWVLKSQNKMLWSQINFLAYFKSGSSLSYLLALASIFIGVKMLGGEAKAWRNVLILIGAHLLIQIINVNNKAWQGPLAWPSFLLNAGLFFFIMDQLVWKVKSAVVLPEKNESKVSPEFISDFAVKKIEDKKVINLKSYRKILFGFGSPKPWGELKTLSSEMLSVKSFAEVPTGIENQIVQINFSKEVVIDIQFSHRENDMYYFKPLNMQKENVTGLNKWLRKIAV